MRAGYFIAHSSGLNAVLNEQIAAIINAAFGLLTILGIAYDPTTNGLKDSLEAQQRIKPKE